MYYYLALSKFQIRIYPWNVKTPTHYFSCLISDLVRSYNSNILNILYYLVWTQYLMTFGIKGLYHYFRQETRLIVSDSNWDSWADSISTQKIYILFAKWILNLQMNIRFNLIIFLNNNRVSYLCTETKIFSSSWGHLPNDSMSFIHSGKELTQNKTKSLLNLRTNLKTLELPWDRILIVNTRDYVDRRIWVPLC